MREWRWERTVGYRSDYDENFKRMTRDRRLFFYDGNNAQTRDKCQKLVYIISAAEFEINRPFAVILQCKYYKPFIGPEDPSRKLKIC